MYPPCVTALIRTYLFLLSASQCVYWGRFLSNSAAAQQGEVGDGGHFGMQKDDFELGLVLSVEIRFFMRINQSEMNKRHKQKLRGVKVLCNKRKHFCF